MIYERLYNLLALFCNNNDDVDDDVDNDDDETEVNILTQAAITSTSIIQSMLKRNRVLMALGTLMYAPIDSFESAFIEAGEKGGKLHHLRRFQEDSKTYSMKRSTFRL